MRPPAGLAHKSGARDELVSAAMRLRGAVTSERNRG